MLKSEAIPVKATFRGCINCEHYKQFFVENRGNIYMFYPTKYGICVCEGKEEFKEPFGKCENFEYEKKR